MLTRVLPYLLVFICFCTQSIKCTEDKKEKFEKISKLLKEVNAGKFHIAVNEPSYDIEEDENGNLQFIPSEPECPEPNCPPIIAKKPCPEAIPLKKVFYYGDLECSDCPDEWDPHSCGLTSADSKKGTGGKRQHSMRSEEL